MASKPKNSLPSSGPEIEKELEFTRYSNASVLENLWSPIMTSVPSTVYSKSLFKTAEYD